jgi:hypothetical protein
MSDSARTGTCEALVRADQPQPIAVIHVPAGDRAASAFRRPVNDGLADLPVVAEGIFDAA